MSDLPKEVGVRLGAEAGASDAGRATRRERVIARAITRTARPGAVAAAWRMATHLREAAHGCCAC